VNTATLRLEVEGAKVHYPVRKGVFRRIAGWVRAVDDVSLAIPAGSTFGLVGESGCGKSSLAHALLRLRPLTAGRVLYRTNGGKAPPVDLGALPERAMRALRGEMQIVFQDTHSALNPRLRVGRILDESLRALYPLPKPERTERVLAALRDVGLPESAATRFAHEFSGGQRQRIAIARALITRPHFIVLDEPVSALDVSVRAQILNLLIELQKSRNLTYLFVSHDLSVIRYLCDHVAVMYLGRIVETGPTAEVFARPLHPYTEQLLAAVPLPKPRARRRPPLLQGDPPSPLDIPAGCPFNTRCYAATDECRREMPAARTAAAMHIVRCHHAFDRKPVPTPETITTGES